MARRVQDLDRCPAESDGIATVVQEWTLQLPAPERRLRLEQVDARIEALQQLANAVHVVES